MMSIENRKLLNFLHPKLSPKVTCKSPAADHYEASNLISSDCSVRCRGFLAYYTIKPPVELEFTFICKVNLHFIKLNTTLGSQKCSGIEILGKSSENSPYTSLGKVSFDKAGLIFCNMKWYKSNTFVNDNDKHICYFNRNAYKAFLNSEFLKVVIFKTEKSVPCLGSVEVWGTPAKSCSPVTSETIYKLMSSCYESKNTNVSITEESNGNVSKEEFKIPSDFLDDLTYDIMTLPVTLPSGKTVDQKTLDKHIENEKLFKRKPCDPFTGKKFTETCKPVINTALKSRIDMFLIQNAYRQETFNLPRIVGRNNISEPTVSSYKRKSMNSTENLNTCFKRSRNELLGNECCKCNIVSNLYFLSCNHVYCRNCILEISKELKCSVCGMEFKKDNIERYHCH